MSSGLLCVGGSEWIFLQDPGWWESREPHIPQAPGIFCAKDLPAFLIPGSLHPQVLAGHLALPPGCIQGEMALSNPSPEAERD